MILRSLLLLLLLAAPAWAHSSSNSYLAVTARGATLDVQWSIALRDLDYAIGLDRTGDGVITWGDVRARAAAIDGYVLPRLGVTADDLACTAGPAAHLADQLGDGGYVVLRFAVTCPLVPHRLGLRYALLFDLDPQHRGLLRLAMDGHVRAAALSPAHPLATFEARARIGATLREFFVAGVAHLFGGADHLLFVAMLLVPAMFRRRDTVSVRPSHWEAVPSFAPAFRETVTVLTAFTAAHALTLTIAVLGVVRVPAASVDAAIAATILATALDNVWRVLPGRRWMLAFGFGLVHGFGYAGTLAPLGLPPLPLAAALVSFNLGLEVAQILVAAMLLPASYALRHARLYRRAVLPALSGAVAVLALAWLTGTAAAWAL